MNINVLKAEKKDLEMILQLQYLAYQSEASLFKDKNIPPLRQTIEELNEEFNNGIILKMIDDNNTIIGSIRAYECDNTVFIGKLMVHPKYRMNGFGSILLLKIEKYFPKKRYELFTSTKSKSNICLYKKMGYEIFNNKVISDDLEFVYMEKINQKILRR